MINLNTSDISKDKRVEIGTRFIIGNGHLGYRGNLEEYPSSDLSFINMVGFYDQFKDKWRESVNFPNPFYFRVFNSQGEISLNTNKPCDHQLILDMENGLLIRHTEFSCGTINSEKFVSSSDRNLLCVYYSFTSYIKGKYTFKLGYDEDIYDINGPHFIKKSFKCEGGSYIFNGETNERHCGLEILRLQSSKPLDASNSVNKDSGLEVSLDLGEGEKIEFTAFCYVLSDIFDDFKKSKINFELAVKKGYQQNKKEHTELFSSQFLFSRALIKSDDNLQIGLDYSNYLLISSSIAGLTTSIPARGQSGQTYKGAIFWDSEMFLLPVYLLSNLTIARNLIVYRINGLKGALKKAQQFNYQGAFYAWESQEDGKEACSMYNVTDSVTNKPIRTYFVDKQIHISADISLAIDRYINYSGDFSILFEGGLDVLFNVVKFYVSYSQVGEDGKYHLNDVIGPDEYHERIDDNAFTNYMAKKAADIFIDCYNKALKADKSKLISLDKEGIMKDYLKVAGAFSKNIYLPLSNNQGVIEQFKNYFSLEDCTKEDIVKRLKDKNQYWGGENGPCKNTRVIKQADTVALIAILDDEFTLSQAKANYEFYLPYTEHGSSLSASMHSLVAFRIGKEEDGLSFLEKSANSDLGEQVKTYAGGIYIGGTHMAAAGGSYLDFIYGLLGVKIVDGKVTCNPHLPPSVKSAQIKIKFKKQVYRIYADQKSISVTAIGGNKND